MAGQGKISARQKMINLMYLVFIAIMAMTVAPEVLSAFGLMELKFADSNVVRSDMNAKLLVNLETKGEEKPKEFAFAAAMAKKISNASENFYKYIDQLKRNIISEGKYEIDSDTGMLPFESMKKGDKLDEKWFTGDRLTKEGLKFMDVINTYKNEIKEVIGEDVKYKTAFENFERRFDVSDIKDSEGVKKDWLHYHFKGFPSIASYTKLTAMQNDIKITEANLYNLYLGNTLDEAITLKNFQAIVLADKSAFFAGEKFQGKVVLGKYANVVPTKLVVNGTEIDLATAIDSTGAAKLDFNVGNVGEHDINGQFTFLEDGQELPIPIVGNYVVVPRPNSATISADKMNVVYRGVDNPMSISFAGVSDNKVNASAPGLNKVGNGIYNMKPTSGSKVTISVNATLSDGSSVRDSKEFRIKDIPKPVGVMAGQDGKFKLPKRNVEIGTVRAELKDFDFDLPLRVTSFKFKVPGQPSITCSGNKLSSQAKTALRRAKPGQDVQIFDIKARSTKSGGPVIKTALPIIIQVTN